MVAYLTSRLGGYYKKDGIRIPAQLSTENGLLEHLQRHWRGDSKVLIISSDADNEDITYPDSYGREFYALEDGSYFQ